MEELWKECECCNDDRCIRQVPLFSSLDSQALHALTKEMQHQSYSKGELIVREGDPAKGFVVIKEGSAKAFKSTSDGREQILYIFPAHDYFGARFLFTEDEVPYSVEALEDTKVCSLSKAQFRRLLAENSEVALQIIEAMANRMSRLETVMQSMGGRNADVRLAVLLLELKDSYGRMNGPFLEIHLPLSREGLANYLGLARETLSRKFAQFEEEGILENLGNKIVRILDYERLTELAVLKD